MKAMAELISVLVEEKSALVEKETEQMDYVMELEERILELEFQAARPVRPDTKFFVSYQCLTVSSYQHSPTTPSEDFSIIDSDIDTGTPAPHPPVSPSPTPFSEAPNDTQERVTSNSIAPVIPNADWEALVDVWTDERGLAVFETNLEKFLNAHTGRFLYLNNIPWPSLVRNTETSFPGSIATETPRLFQYALQNRSKEQAEDLLQKTIEAFQPAKWKELNILKGVMESLAGMIIDRAKAVREIAIQMLTELRNEAF